MPEGYIFRWNNAFSKVKKANFLFPCFHSLSFFPSIHLNTNQQLRFVHNFQIEKLSEKVTALCLWEIFFALENL